MGPRVDILKLDSFEQDKVEATKLLRQLKDFIETKEAGDDSLSTMRAITSNYDQVDRLCRKMGVLYENMRRRQGVWEKMNVPNDVLLRRENDWKQIRSSVLEMKKRKQNAIVGEAPGVSKPQFHNADQALAAQKEIQLPEIDISEGLQQINDLKNRRDELLGTVDNQVNILTDIAVSQGEELNKQHVILDNVDRMTTEQNAKLKKINKMKSCCVIT
jgi:hypothetical protein